MKKIIFITLLTSLLNFSLVSAKQADQGIYAIKNGLLQGILAKELCTCIYVTKIGPEHLNNEERGNLCLKKANLPVSETVIKTLVSIQYGDKTLKVTPKILGSLVTTLKGKSRTARFLSERDGCSLNAK